MILANTSVNSTVNSLEWGTIAAWIALAVAIISPVIVAIITNRNQAKMKKAEIFENRGLSIIEEYLDVVSREITTCGGGSEKYDRFYAKIFLYAPKSTWQDLKSLDTLIKNTPQFNFPNRQEGEELIQKISKQLTYTKICK